MKIENIEFELENETKKWLEKIKERRQKVKVIYDVKADMVKNIDAYVSDSQMFLKERRFIHAFEAVIWAWAWIDILEELKIISSE